MNRFESAERIGLRDKETGKLIAVYPDRIEGSEKEIEDKVRYWFYQKSCSAEDLLFKSEVDVLTDQELKLLKSTH